MLTITWPDGSVLTGATATEVLERLGAEQWRPCDGPTMKMRLLDRCFVWSGCYVDPDKDDGAFLHALAGAGLFSLAVTV